MRFLSDNECNWLTPRKQFGTLLPHLALLLRLAGAEKGDFYEQIPIMLREMLYRLNDDNEAVLKANQAAFSALSNKVPAEELVKHVEFMRNLLASMVSDARRRKGGVGDGEFLLPGFNIPKGKHRNRI
jgi:hypothetical protein